MLSIDSAVVVGLISKSSWGWWLSVVFFVQKTLEAGVPVTYFRIDGMDHWIRKRPDVIDQSFDWLNSTLYIFRFDFRNLLIHIRLRNARVAFQAYPRIPQPNLNQYLAKLESKNVQSRAKGANRSRKMRFYLRRISLGLIALIFVFIVIIFYPQCYYFNDKIEYKNFRVYCDIKIPDQIYPILDEVDRLIRQSDCYDPQLKFKIFLRSDVNKYNFFSGQFPEGGFGQTISLIKNVFIYKSDCATNTSYTHLGATRTLSNVLAHELMHVLIENKWLFKSKTEYFLSKLGRLWKEEGYAEYVAGGPTLSLDDGLKMLNNEISIECVPQFEYFKYWLAVRHLILEKHMTFEEILYAKLNLDDVLQAVKHELAGR